MFFFLSNGWHRPLKKIANNKNVKTLKQWNVIYKEEWNLIKADSFQIYLPENWVHGNQDERSSKSMFLRL